MKLAVKTCKTCGKIVSGTQAEFKMGKLINYVWSPCGHLEISGSKIDLTPITEVKISEPELVKMIENKNEFASELEKQLEDFCIECGKEIEIEAANNKWCLNCLKQEPSEVEKQLTKSLSALADGTLTQKAADLKDTLNTNLNQVYFKSLPEDVEKVLSNEVTKLDSFANLDKSKVAYDFQVDGIKFIEEGGLVGLIGDAMGLGKTIQAALILKRNREKLLPCILFTKATCVFQITRELKDWFNDDLLSVAPVMSRAQLIPGFDVYVMSMDFSSREGVKDLLVKLHPKSTIYDESHGLKDPSSKRTISYIKLVQEAKIKHRIFLSGTPIKNRADEYFTILNLIAPQYFRSLAQFRRDWLVQNEKGAYTRINPFRLDQFRELTSKFIIRREKHEVLKNLPSLTRDYQLTEIEDEGIKKSYNQQLDLFSNFMQNTANINSTEILGWLTKLRAITGQAKCKAALEWSQDFLDSSDESLAIGIQHKSVRDTLYNVLDMKGFNPLKLSGEDDPYRKDQIVKKFDAGQSRILVINMIAGGTGLNLQSCANSLVLERQWSSADEEQFEGRFHRNGQVRAVTVTYLIARGTLDEWFHNMVERKRRILGETLSGWDLTNDEGSLRDLADLTIQSRLK